ncbi:MAG: tRNA 2-thiouridine(34) synthase MnmA [Polyangiaceae bacterium]|nr:tRNA 2-thiouridine(34) synthase MnmA [Polyangiaceae bacterium]
MSGGVDSSVAAARLLSRGYDVVGVTLHLWDYPDESERGRCCAPEDQYDARRVADHLGFPHYTFDRRELFQELVVGPFVDDYLAGRTPSPCVSCNRGVKLRQLLPIADRLGAAFVATGHYARVVEENGIVSLHRGRDGRKDQSYFLHMLRPDELRRLVLPLGDATKEEVRAEAVAARLPGATKGESQELCFVASGRYDAFVEQRADGRVRPGPIVTSDGQVVGEHGGVHRFTVGQRKGLGVALGKPAFVVGVDASTGAVTVGSEDALLSSGAKLADDTVFTGEVELPCDATVQVRARHGGAPATLVRADDGSVEVRFVEPVRAVSPGQVAVAYHGTRVLGGGTIVAALR